MSKTLKICRFYSSGVQENKELLIAIIEVFIHDPLFNWCINDTTNETKKLEDKNSSDSGKGHLSSTIIQGIGIITFDFSTIGRF